MDQRAWERLFLVVGSVFALAGVVLMTSIGFPLLVVGVASLVAYRFRRSKRAFAAIMLGSVAGLIALMLIVPLSCSATSKMVAGGPSHGGRVTCENLAGIDYSGREPYNAPLWPALSAGVGVGSAVGVTAAAVLRDRRNGALEADPSERDPARAK
jgi:hypothetical protein